MGFAGWLALILQNLGMGGGPVAAPPPVSSGGGAGGTLKRRRRWPSPEVPRRPTPPPVHSDQPLTGRLALGGRLADDWTPNPTPHADRAIRGGAAAASGAFTVRWTSRAQLVAEDLWFLTQFLE